MTREEPGPGDPAAQREGRRPDADDVVQAPKRQPRETALGQVHRLARFIPLVEAWRTPGPGRPALAASERDMLAVAHLSMQKGTSLLIRVPGGLHRLPLLTAVMAAAESLDVPQFELSRLSGAAPPPGPVALVTERMIRRTEIDQLDALAFLAGEALGQALARRFLDDRVPGTAGIATPAPAGGGSTAILTDIARGGFRHRR